MNFAVINRDLNIQACSPKEMSQEIVDQFAIEYTGGNIDALVSFYIPNTDTIVLNMDNEYFEMYKKLFPAYLECDKESREIARKQYGGPIDDTLDFLEQVIKRRDEMKAAIELKRILGKQSIQPYYEAIESLQALKSVDNTYSDPGSKPFSEYNAFTYGYISGIRAERERRKRSIH